MTPVQIFHEIWMKQGRIESLRHPIPTDNHGFADHAAMLMLCSGSITDFDLRLCRMLYDKVYDRCGCDDETLQLFLIAMTASLNRGNVRMSSNPPALAGEYHSLLVDALGMTDNDDLVRTGFLRHWPIEDISRMCADMASDFCLRNAGGVYRAIIGTDAKPVIGTDAGFYFQKYHTAERRLGELLKQRLAGGDRQIDDECLKRALSRCFCGAELDILQKLAIALSCLNCTTIITGGPGTGKTTVVSRALLAHFLLDPTLAPEDVLIAAPTGRAAARLQESIAVSIASLAGTEERAINLSSISGQTVHSILGFDPRTGGFRRNSLDPVEARIVVVDEVSMLDITVFCALLEALDPETVLILVGDRDQLPSVEAGAVLGDLTASFQSSAESHDHRTPVATLTPALHSRLSTLLCGCATEMLTPGLIRTAPHPLAGHCVVLTRSFRSIKAIADFSVLVRSQHRDPGSARFTATQRLFVANSPDPSETGVFSIQTIMPDLVLTRWFQDHFASAFPPALEELSRNLEQSMSGLHESNRYDILRDAGRNIALAPHFRSAFHYLHHAMVLCIVRKGDWGSIRSNDAARSVLLPLCDPGSDDELFHGCAAMCTRNQADRALWNGDRGLILRLTERRWFVVQRAGYWDCIPIEEVIGLEPAFAMTVHKSQGSEFDRVLLMLLPSGDHPLMSREIIYTALTRARISAAVAGQPEAFDAAVGRRMHRKSGLEALIQ